MSITEHLYMISPCRKHAWINIPKNASSFTKGQLLVNDWQPCDKEILYDPDIQKICILRNPMWRWISGFSQTMLDYKISTILDMLDNEDFWKILCINPVLDNHTEFQYKFVEGLNNVKYIYLEDRDSEFGFIKNANQFYLDLSDYIKYTGGKNCIEHWTHVINPAENDTFKFQVFEKVRELIKDRYHTMLKTQLRLDYLLLDQLTEFCYNKQNSTNEKIQ